MECVQAFVRESMAIQLALGELIKLAESRQLVDIPQHVVGCYIRAEEALSVAWNLECLASAYEDALLKHVALHNNTMPTFHAAAIRLCIDGLLAPFDRIAVELYARADLRSIRDIPAHDREAFSEAQSRIAAYLDLNPIKKLNEVQIGLRIERKQVEANAPMPSKANAPMPSEFLSAAGIATKLGLPPNKCKTLANALTGGVPHDGKSPHKQPQGANRLPDDAYSILSNAACRRPVMLFDITHPAVRKHIDRVSRNPGY